jgi:hypothetical protein
LVRKWINGYKILIEDSSGNDLCKEDIWADLVWECNITLGVWTHELKVYQTTKYWTKSYSTTLKYTVTSDWENNSSTWSTTDSILNSSSSSKTDREIYELEDSVVDSYKLMIYEKIWDKLSSFSDNKKVLIVSKIDSLLKKYSTWVKYSKNKLSLLVALKDILNKK